MRRDDTTQELRIKKLRTSPSSKRREVALELAKSESAIVVKELIHMARGGRRTLLRWYNLEDQLIALEALGDTRSQEALDYLELVRTRKVSLTQSSYVGGTQEVQVITFYATVEFPNSRRGLRKHMKYEFERGSSHSIPPYDDPDTEDYPAGESKCVEVEQSIRALVIIKASIEKLRQQLFTQSP